MEDRYNVDALHSGRSAQSADVTTQRHSAYSTGYNSINNSNKIENRFINYIPPRTIEEITANPIECGYLLAYCDSQYSSENIRFVVEVNRFVESLKRDQTFSKNVLIYKELDRLTNIGSANISIDNIPLKGKDLDFGKSSDWTSLIVPRSTVIDHIIAIYDEFISTNAPTQICLPSQVLTNTIHRIKNLHRYTFQIFEEAILDPIKTLKRDVLPRFLLSEHYKRCVSKCTSLYPLPTLKEFTFAMPSTAKVLLWPDEQLTLENLRKVDWYTLLHDNILFGQFLKYTQSIVNSENLLCARLSAKYMCLWEAAGYPGKTNTFISLSCSSAQSAEITRASSNTAKGKGAESTSPTKFHQSVITLQPTENLTVVRRLKCPPEAEKILWFVLRFFILPNSVYEISLSHRKRKEIMENLADPKYNLFDKVIKSVINVLRVSYDSYTRTEYFKCLPSLIKSEKQKIEIESVKHRMNRCFPMFS